jgi:hypothetical protein
MTGALFLSASNPIRESRNQQSGLYRSIKWLNDINCLPLQTGGILEKLSQTHSSTFDLHK